MSTTTVSRTTHGSGTTVRSSPGQRPAGTTSRWGVWRCANCATETPEPRKRCRECRTSRY